MRLFRFEEMLQRCQRTSMSSPTVLRATDATGSVPRIGRLMEFSSGKTRFDSCGSEALLNLCGTKGGKGLPPFNAGAITVEVEWTSEKSYSSFTGQVYFERIYPSSRLKTLVQPK